MPGEIEEYEIDTGAIEALNSVEKRAAIEPCQEQENIKLSGQISQRGAAMARAFSLEELEAMKARVDAQIEEDRAAAAAEKQRQMTGPAEGAKQESRPTKEVGGSGEACEPRSTGVGGIDALSSSRRSSNMTRCRASARPDRLPV
jgi:hypothetical protein